MSYNNLLNFISTQNDKFPPVHLWDPELCKGPKFYINHNGEWFFNDSLIKRHNLCVLFSRIIKRDKKNYYLVTPVEKIELECAIAPYKIIDFEIDDTDNILFKTNLDFAYKPQNSCSSRLVEYDFQLVPAIEIRNGIEGYFDRNVYYKLADLVNLYGLEKDNKIILKFTNISFELGISS